MPFGFSNGLQRPKQLLPTASNTRSNRSLLWMKSSFSRSITVVAPSERTSAMFGVSATAVTVAPRCRASCTAAEPMAPVAPFTSTCWPGPTSAARRSHSA